MESCGIMYRKVGLMLSQLRKQAEIPQNDLARGILTVDELSKVEKGKKGIDRMSLDALFQRIGKSLDKMELAMSMEEYRLLELRFNILNMLSVKDAENPKDTETPDTYIEKYAAYIDDSKPIQRQALMLLHVVKSYIENGNAGRNAALFEKALEITFPKWQEMELINVRLCTQEIQLLLAILYIKLNIEGNQDNNLINLPEEQQQMFAMLQKLYDYIDNRYTDEEERAKVYPQCAWILSSACLWRGDIRMAYEICQKGVDCLAENGVLTVMEELLEVKIKCLEKLGVVDGIQKAQNHKDSIAFLHEVVGKPRISEKIVMVFLTSIQGEIVVTNELIREMRLSQKMSQEELSADICTQETLSRIESGMRTPNTNKLYQMFKRLGIERERYYGFIAADDYALYEKVRLHKRNIGREEVEQAEQIFDELVEKLDYEDVVNKQFIDTCRIAKQLRKKEISCESAYEELKKILDYTMKDYVGTVYRVPFRQEVVILNQMARCLRRAKREEVATEIYAQILNRYNNSMVLKVFHSVSAMLIYINYTGLLETMDKLDESEAVGKEGISLMLDCQRGDAAGMILANLSCVYDKRDAKKDAELAKNCLSNSYYLMDLYMYERDKKMLKNAYEEIYRTVLD